MRLHICFFDPTPAWSAMKADIYLSLRDCLERATGRDVSMDGGRWRPGAFNVLVGLQYLDRRAVAELTRSSIRFGLFDVEILDQGMVNYKPETRRFFVGEERALFDRASFLLSYFRQSCAELRKVGLPSYHVTPGFCPALQTHAPLPDDRRDIDVLFFGHVNSYREPILRDLSRRCHLVVRQPCDETSLKERNALATRARLVLSLGRAAPFGHVGPMRLISMAHLPVFCLSERGRLPQPELAPFARFVEAERLSEQALALLADPGARSAGEAEAADALQRLQPVAQLQRCFDECL